MKSSIRRSALTSSFALALVVAVWACDSSDDQTTPPPTDVDASGSTDTGSPKADTGPTKCYPETAPAQKTAKACVPGEVHAVVQDCFVGTGTGGCTGSQKVHPKCHACLFSGQQDQTWGPWVQTPQGGFEGNAPGCIALKPGGAECSAKAAENFACVHNACCAAQTQEEFEPCSQTARAGSCQELQNAMLTCAGSVPDANKCLRVAHPSTVDWLEYLGDVFCGGADGDAGVDASTDAAQDAPVDAPADG